MATPKKADAVEKLLRQLVSVLGYDNSESATEKFVCQMAAATDAVKITIAEENRDGLNYDAIPELAELLATEGASGNARGLSATTRMVGARDNRKRILGERNEVIAVLAQLWDSHTMPPKGRLDSLDRRVVCIHSPAKLLCWPISKDEADEHFKDLPKLAESDWDDSSAAERSKRLAELRQTLAKDRGAVYATPQKPSKKKKATPAVEPPARRPGEFHRPRAKRAH